jgi:TonB family protein
LPQVGPIKFGQEYLSCTMGDLQSRGLSGIGVENFDSSSRVGTSATVQSFESSDLLVVLRQNLQEGLQPPAAIMHATAEAARILTGSDGAALALRTKGVIVCRACSGDPTPDLGTPLNVDSGISGECLRAASILVCDDAENDARVDPDVCRYLGIRSIAVVPLRGPSGIAGILELFSTHVGAFRENEINTLRALAEIAEAAYGREVRGLQEAPAPPPKAARIRMLSDERPDTTVTGKQNLDEASPKRRVWFIGIAVVAMLLVAGVWLSGHEPGLETSAKEPPAQPHSVSTESPNTVPVTVALPKPKAGIARTGGSAAEVLKNAAQIDVIEESKPLVIATGHAPAAPPAENSATPTASSSLDPPSVTMDSSESRNQLSNLAAPNTLPALDAPISKGLTAGQLIHKVDPVYPSQARAEQLSGTVALEVTVAEDGSVQNVKRISGNPVLAAAASEAIRRWRYTPFLLNGKPLEVKKQISVIFKLP